MQTATINAAIGLAWTVAVIVLAATGTLGAVWIALLHNLGTFIVIANAGRLLRMDEDSDSAGLAHAGVAQESGSTSVSA